MAITSKGIVYPNNYSEIADIPEVMKEMADSIDEVLENQDNKIENKVEKINGKCLSTNDYTNEEKGKLANLENYDDTEVKQDIADLETNKADKSEIPDVSNFITKMVADLVNYYKKSETYTQTEVNNLIGAIQQFHYEIVEALPITGANNIIYLVAKELSETDNVYDEYVYANNNWEKIGDTTIDLSDYYTKSQVNALIPTVPTNVSAFTNDAGYLTQHQDISGKLDTSKVKNTKSTTAGDVYDVRYINTMLGDIESLLGGI